MDNHGGGPIFPLEVVNFILGNLDGKELLKCRLISQSWNQFCLEHLEREKYVQELSVNEVKEYADFLQKSQTTPLLALKIRIGEIFTLPLAADMDFLISCAGTNSVVELDLNPGAVDSEKSTSICSLLGKLAPDLLSLSLTEPSFLTMTSRRDFFAKIQTMAFPKLKALCLKPYQGWSEAKEGELFSVLIGRCPCLKMLDVSSSAQVNENSPIRIPFETGLKNLKLRSFMEPTVLVQAIRNVPANQIALESLACGFGFSLEFLSDWTLLQCQAMREIMEVLSPKLRSFSYSIQSWYQHLMTSSFPVLTTLNLYLSNLETWLYFTDIPNPIPCSLSQVLLPSLKRVAFPIGIYWNAPDDLPVIGSVLELTFQAHAWVTPTIGEQYFSASETQSCLANAFRAFPNATRLTLRKSRTGYLALRKLLLGLIQCHNAEGICELTVKDYREDYIGQNFLQLMNPPVIGIVIDKASIPERIDQYDEHLGMNSLSAVSSYFEQPGIATVDLKITEDSDSLRIETIATPQLLESCFTNVSKLTLLLPRNDANKSPELGFQLDMNVTADNSQIVENTPTPRRILYLDHISKCFPNLRILEMSAGILGAVGTNPLPGWEWEMARKIESMYSNWTVQLTRTAPGAEND